MRVLSTDCCFLRFARCAAGVDEDEAMYTFQDKDILECEFYVVEALQFDLILHHPFPSLLQ